MLQEKQDKFKIILLGIIFLSIIPQFVSAQNDFQKEFNWGVNGGVAISSMSFNPKVRQGSLLQGVGGVSLRYVSEKNFGIQCELNYSQRGWKEEFPKNEGFDDDQQLYYSRVLNYLELPIFTHIYFDAGKRFRVVFNLGPQLGYLLSESDKASFDTTGADESVPSYYSQKLQRSFDWGLCFGGGLEFRTNSGSFVLDGRYYYGLSDIFTNSRTDPSFNFAASSNQIISVKLTYLFKLKAKS